MEIVNIKKDCDFLNEYIKLCSIEWSKSKTKEEMAKYIEEKKKSIHTGDKVISVSK